MPPVVVTRCRRFMNSPNPSHGNCHGCHGITGANDIDKIIIRIAALKFSCFELLELTSC